MKTGFTRRFCQCCRAFTEHRIVIRFWMWRCVDCHRAAHRGGNAREADTRAMTHAEAIGAEDTLTARPRTPAPRFILAGLTMDDLIRLLWIVVEQRRDVRPTGVLCQRIATAIRAADPEYAAWRQRRWSREGSR